MCEKFKFGILVHVNENVHENGKFLGSIIGDSVIACEEIIKVTKAIPTKTVSIKTITTNPFPLHFNEKKLTCKREYIYILLVFSKLPYHY